MIMTMMMESNMTRSEMIIIVIVIVIAAPKGNQGACFALENFQTHTHTNISVPISMAFVQINSNRALAAFEII